MKIEPEVIGVLSRVSIEANAIRLPPGQLDRALYVKVDKVLQSIGGKWSRSAKCHVFDSETAAEDALEPILLTGETVMPAELGQFDTPPDVVARVMERAGIEPDMHVLEPSAGLGNLALTAAANGGLVTCYEIDPKRVEKLRRSKFAGGWVETIGPIDFLDVFPSATFDRVVMNPPFAKQADLEHVQHAAGFLKPGGRLVSVMSPSFTFRQNRKSAEFRRWCSEHMRTFTVEDLPEGSFKTSGTTVRTVIITLEAH